MNIKIEMLERNTGQVPGIPKNPRRQSKKKLEDLKKSILELPEMVEYRPLLVYPFKGKYVIIGGNMRYRALAALGYREVPCQLIPDDMPVDKIKAIVLQDNNSFGEDDWYQILKGWDVTELNALSYDIPQFIADELNTLTNDANKAFGESTVDIPSDDTAETEPNKKQLIESIPSFLRKEKNKAWGQGDRKDVARCDLTLRPGIISRAPYFVAHSFRRSEDGEPITEIKSKANVTTFAASACSLIRGLLGCGAPESYAIITAPPRRHKDWNFAVAVAEKISEVLGLRFYNNAFEIHNADRIHPDLELKEKIVETNLIIYDDILTTGSTLKALAAFFQDKNVTLVVGINNN